MQDDGQPLF